MSNSYGDRIQAAVAAQLRAEREIQNMTMDVFAEKVGQPKTTLARYLKGQRDIPFSTLMAMCAAFDVSVATIVDRAQARLDEEDLSAGKAS